MLQYNGALIPEIAFLYQSFVVSPCVFVELSLVVTLRPAHVTQARTYITRPFSSVSLFACIRQEKRKNAIMSRPGFSYAEAIRGPVPVPRSGSIAGLAYIPPYGEAFPPFAPPPTPTPAATVSLIAFVIVGSATTNSTTTIAGRVRVPAL